MALSLECDGGELAGPRINPPRMVFMAEVLDFVFLIQSLLTHFFGVDAVCAPISESTQALFLVTSLPLNLQNTHL